MISANGGLPAHRYTPQVTQRWPPGSGPASEDEIQTMQGRTMGRADGHGRGHPGGILLVKDPNSSQHAGRLTVHTETRALGMYIELHQ